jgi:hypothetical protein
MSYALVLQAIIEKKPSTQPSSGVYNHSTVFGGNSMPGRADVFARDGVSIPGLSPRRPAADETPVRLTFGSLRAGFRQAQGRLWGHPTSSVRTFPFATPVMRQVGRIDIPLDRL